MVIKVKNLIYIVCMLFSLGIGVHVFASELDIVPPPASAHSTTDILLLNSSGIATSTSAPPPTHVVKAVPHSDIPLAKPQEKAPLPLASQKAIDAIVTSPAKKTPSVQEEIIDPYQLEEKYGITKAPQTQVAQAPQVPQSTVVRTQKTLPPQTTTTTVKTVKTIKEPEYSPQVDEEGSWQASGYRFSPELNKIQYPADSPLKMITLQIMVEVSSSGSTASKVRELLDKINNALPDAVLIAGLRELYSKYALYPLAQWDRHSFTKAIKRVSSRKQTGTIGYGLQEIRPSLLNLPYPLNLLLITDGEHYNIENLAFDTKIFYAPDPRAPLHIISFATTKEEKESIRIIQRVHHGTYVFDGNKLLRDQSAFAAFMKALLVK